MKTLTIDIETLPDLAAHQRAGMDPAAGFPPFAMHEIACVSVLTVESHDWDSRRFGIETLSRETTSERGIILEIEQMLASADEVVTFNGRAFDVPVLLARAAVTGQAVPRITRLYRRSHVGFHADLLEEVTAFGIAPRLKLAQLCAAFAIPAKLDIDGGGVGELARAGEWKRISDYCETDVVATWLAQQMWRSTQLAGLGHQRWQELSAWIMSEQPTLTHLLPYAQPPAYPLGGNALGDTVVSL